MLYFCEDRGEILIPERLDLESENTAVTRRGYTAVKCGKHS